MLINQIVQQYNLNKLLDYNFFADLIIINFLAMVQPYKQTIS